MSFYVTLPSNSSMDLYPENTMTDFTVLLKDPIRLEVQYEVALVDLTYKHSWSLEVVYHDGENIQSFTSRLNGEIWKFYINKEYDRRLELGKY
ncbi:unnamed protein product [Brachionus calyciflorus]|uniref:Uncharacterized protein n=1 Tax=Brachionus calyciflorus TaxID=104777 RepID=A0A814N8L0_9BILA|nr:unnamed protein product [Brachionus calyciflorus]